MSDDEFNRRNVLKKFGATAAAAAGLGAGSASAEEAGRYEETYADADARRQSLETHAGEVLAELAARDIIETASLEEFDLETEAADRSVGAATTAEGYAFRESVDREGRRTGHIELSASPDGYDLSVHVRPEAGQRYALVHPEDGEKFAIDPDAEVVKLEVSSDCSGYCDCGPQTCRTFPTVLYEANYWDCYQSYDRCRCYNDRTECGCDPLVGC